MSLYPTRGFYSASRHKAGSKQAPNGAKDPSNIYKDFKPSGNQKEEAQKERRVLLRLTVDLGDGENDVIIIKENDNLQEVAVQFCQRNQLEQEGDSFEFVLRNIQSNYELALREKRRQRTPNGVGQGKKTNRSQKENKLPKKKNVKADKEQLKPENEKKGKKEKEPKSSEGIHERLYNDSKQRKLRCNWMKVENEQETHKKMPTKKSIEIGKRLYEAGMNAKIQKL